MEFSFAPPAASMEGRVEAYTESAKDGSVEDLVSVPVTISADQPPIVLTSPQCNQEITSPLLVEGTASVFEGAIIIVVKDSAGRELARTPVQALRGCAPRGVPFLRRSPSRPQTCLSPAQSKRSATVLKTGVSSTSSQCRWFLPLSLGTDSHCHRCPDLCAQESSSTALVDGDLKEATAPD